MGIHKGYKASKESVAKRSASLKRRYMNPSLKTSWLEKKQATTLARYGKLAWNKGLSMKDPRVQASAKKRNETMLQRYGRLGPSVGWNKGQKTPEIVRNKQSEAAKKRWIREREKIIQAQNRGKRASEKFKTKNIGTKRTEEQKQWMRANLLPRMVQGWKNSAKWKEATSRANNSPEHLAFLSDMRSDPVIEAKRAEGIRLAHIRNPEWRMATSRRSKLMWANPEYREAKMKQLERNATKNTSIELKLQESLLKKGIPFLVGPRIDGVAIPDIQLADSKILIFADGCYWHGCPIHFPSQRDKKLTDERITNQLGLFGWIVFRFWEHEIKANSDYCISKIIEEHPELKVSILKD